jgi:hypothetical protein
MFILKLMHAEQIKDGVLAGLAGEKQTVGGIFNCKGWL